MLTSQITLFDKTQQVLLVFAIDNIHVLLLFIEIVGAYI